MILDEAGARKARYGATSLVKLCEDESIPSKIPSGQIKRNPVQRRTYESKFISLIREKY